MLNITNPATVDMNTDNSNIITIHTDEFGPDDNISDIMLNNDNQDVLFEDNTVKSSKKKKKKRYNSDGKLTYKEGDAYDGRYDGSLFNKNEDDGTVYPLHTRKLYMVITFVRDNIRYFAIGLCVIVSVIIIISIFSGSSSKSKPVPVINLTPTPVYSPARFIPPKFSNLPPRRAVTPPRMIPSILRPPKA